MIAPQRNRTVVTADIEDDRGIFIPLNQRENALDLGAKPRAVDIGVGIRGIDAGNSGRAQLGLGIGSPEIGVDNVQINQRDCTARSLQGIGRIERNIGFPRTVMPGNDQQPRRGGEGKRNLRDGNRLLSDNGMILLLYHIWRKMKRVNFE